MHLRNILQKIIISVVILFIVIYGGYKLYPIVSGPKIEIISTEKSKAKDDKANSKLLTIKGRVLRAKEIKIFDRKISVTPDGYFEENIVAQDIFTNIVITAKDKYGRVTTEKYFVQE